MSPLFHFSGDKIPSLFEGLDAIGATMNYALLSAKSLDGKAYLFALSHGLNNFRQVVCYPAGTLLEQYATTQILGLLENITHSKIVEQPF